MLKAAQYIKYTLAVMIFFVIVCIFIRPEGWSANDGISYYGTYKSTILPYSLAFISSAWCCWKAAASLPDKFNSTKYLAVSLKLMSILLIGLLLTPASILESLHMTIGSILFSMQLLVSVWLVIISQFVWPSLIFPVIEVLSGIAALYYLPRPSGWLLQVQVIFQLAFGLLLIVVLSKAPDQSQNFSQETKTA